MSFGNKNNQCSSEAPATFVRQNHENDPSFSTMVRKFQVQLEFALKISS